MDRSIYSPTNTFSPPFPSTESHLNMVFYCLVGSTSCSEEGLWSEMDHHTVQVHRASRKASDTQYYFVQQEKKMELSGCSLAWHTSVTLEKSFWKIAKSKYKPHSGLLTLLGDVGQGWWGREGTAPPQPQGPTSSALGIVTAPCTIQTHVSSKPVVKSPTLRI